MRDAELTVDAVVVTTNRRELVLKCLAHLNDPILRNVIVVVNASTDHTAEAVTAEFPDVELVEFEQTASLPRTNNAGAARTTAPLILFLNDDILPTPGAITTLANELVARPDAVAAGGRLVDPETLQTQEQYRPRRLPTLASFLVLLLDIERLWPMNPITQRHWGVDLPEDTVVDAEQPPGACLLVRKDALGAIGGFDERYWVWYEDADLLRRLRQRGGQTLWVPTAVFRHLGGGSVGRWTQADVVRSRYQGILWYARAHFDRRRQIVLAVVLATVSVPRIIAFRTARPAVARAYRSIAAASLDLLRGREIRRLVSESQSSPPV